MADNQTAEPGVETAETDENQVAEGQIEGQEGAETAEKRTPWFQKRINELTAARRAESAAKEQLQRENEALKAMLPKGDDGKTPAPAAQDFDTAVTARAEAMRRTDEFNRASAAVYDKGVAAFPGKFETAIANLQAAGVLAADNTGFLEAALVTEAPERVLYELGQNPEEAMRLASLPAPQLAIALDRMARDTKDKPISATPAPITPLATARASKAFDPSDTKATDMRTWLREREKQIAANKN